MAGSGKQPDIVVVAERLYRRNGVRDTTFFYKHADNTNEIFAKARTARKEEVARAQIEALQKWGALRGAAPPSDDKSMAGWFQKYFAWQEGLPASSTLKKAASTVQTNKWEQTRLLAFFGAMLPAAVTATLIYDYVDIRTAAGAGPTAVKEVALLSAVFEYIRRKGGIEHNPCHGVKLEKSAPRTRNVTWDEIQFVAEVGRSLGGTAHIQSLAMRAAWLAFKRPGEVLKVPKSGFSPQGRPLGITDEGLVFLANKRKKKQGEKTILIEWSPELRATIDEALAAGRWQSFGGERLIFANMAGQAYTKSGWGTMLRHLMDACEVRAKWMDRPFLRFALADCRPGGVTEKKRLSARGAREHEDVYDGTGHADHRMVDSIYDRREETRAKPAK